MVGLSFFYFRILLRVRSGLELNLCKSYTLFQFAKKNIIQIKKQVKSHVRDGPDYYICSY